MHLFAPTQARRETLTQEARVIVPPLAHPVNAVRRVQILIPASPDVLIGIDTVLAKLGPNRTYKLGQWPPGAPVTITLGSGQWLVGASSIGLAHVTVIVEHLVDA